MDNIILKNTRRIKVILSIVLALMTISIFYIIFIRTPSESRKEALENEKSLYDHMREYYKDKGIPVGTDNLLNVFINLINNPDYVKVYYHNENDKNSNRDNYTIVFQLSYDEAQGLSRKLKAKNIIKQIYSTGHPLMCNCVARSFKGWVFEFYKIKDITVQCLTADGKKMYAYSSELEHAEMDDNRVPLYSSISFELDDGFLDYMIRMLNRANIDFNKYEYGWR